MKFKPGHVYHVYNRGNNKVRIFFKEENYHYFLRKIKNEWLKCCEIYCYCLMPNHFHFMLSPTEEGCQPVLLNGTESALQNLSKAIGKTLSSYTQAINIQNKTTGTLFQKKTRSKILTEELLPDPAFSMNNYLRNCFFYIHNNPLKAALVKDHTEWLHSSWAEYHNLTELKLCDAELTKNKLGLNEHDIYALYEHTINEEWVGHIWESR
ncbi:MAG: hypothetical protein HZA79_05565 [Sphingobacteriales bacterium]|nr:hypothetical protein [Sphingobacteriales bacterium]